MAQPQPPLNRRSGILSLYWIVDSMPDKYFEPTPGDGIRDLPNPVRSVAPNVSRDTSQAVRLGPGGAWGPAGFDIALPMHHATEAQMFGKSVVTDMINRSAENEADRRLFLKSAGVACQVK